MKDMLNKPAKLESFIKKNQKVSDAKVQEAVAEACFRLALHPSTPSLQRFQYLQQAYKRDGTNPKYAYHMGRLYFQHGQMENAGEWLTRAARLCPTSHRIWAHIRLLHHELNLRYKNNADIDAAVFKARGDTISQKIRGMQDDFHEADLLNFTPPKSMSKIEEEARKKNTSPTSIPVPSTETAEPKAVDHVERILKKGEIRWSGIYDLEIEIGLDRTATAGQQKILFKELRESLDQWGSKRKSGLSAFCILAIQWLVAGYSVLTIRRLMASQTDARTSASWSLLDTTCRLYECDVEALPQRMAEALSLRAIPEFLAALIHRQRLLWHPLQFDQVSVYLSARNYLESCTDSGEDGAAQKRQIASYSDDLQKFISIINKPAPVAMEDIRDDDKRSSLTVNEEITQMMELEDQIRRQLDTYWGMVADPAAELPTATGIEIRAFLLKVDQLKQLALDEIIRLRELGNNIEDRQREAIDKIEAAYRNIQPGRFKSKLKKLNLPELSDAEKKHAESVSLFKAKSGAESLTADERLHQLAIQSDEIKNTLGVHWTKVKELTENHDGNYTGAEEEQLREIFQYTGHVKKTTQQALAEIDLVASSNTVGDAALLEKVRSAYQSVSVQTFEKRFKKLPFLKADDGKPQGEIKTIRTKQSPGSTQPAVSREIVNSLAALSDLLDRVDDELDHLVSSINNTFAFYPLRHGQFAPLEDLYIQVRLTQAETYYRMGRHSEARRAWSDILAHDPFNLAALKNMAVLNMNQPEVGQMLSSWSAYTEGLYARAIMTGDPSTEAKIRADFHHKYASSFLPAGFTAAQNSEESRTLDPYAVIAFFQSPARLRSFIDHTLLEFYNRKLDFLSHPLILGVNRSEGEETRRRARMTLKAFTEEVASFFPSQVGIPFAKICAAYFDKAFDVCKTTDNLLTKNDPHYMLEQDKQLRWVVDQLLLLRSFAHGMTFHEDVLASINTFETLEQIDRLLKFPFNLSKSFLMPAVQYAGTTGLKDYLFSIDLQHATELDRQNVSAGLERAFLNAGHDLRRTRPGEPPPKVTIEIRYPATEWAISGDDGGYLAKKEGNEIKIYHYTFLLYFDHIKSRIILNTLSKILRDPTEENGDEPNWQYQRLISHWVKHPLLLDYQIMLNDPKILYPKSITSFLQNPNFRDNDQNALSDLRAWHRAYPELAGPATYLASLLYRNNKRDEAIKVLKHTIAHAINRDGAKHCQDLLDNMENRQIAKSRNFEDLVERARGNLRAEPGEASHLKGLLDAYREWNTQDPFTAIDRIKTIYQDWEDWQRAQIDPAAEDIDQWRLLVAESAYAAPKKFPGDKAKLTASYQALQSILKRDAANIHAVYCQMVTCEDLSKLGTGENPDAGRKYLQEAVKLADRVLTESQNPGYQERAEMIKNQIQAVALQPSRQTDTTPKRKGAT